MGKAGEGRDEGKYCGCGGRRAGGHRGPPLQTTYVTRRRGRPPCRPVVGVCTPVVPLIRHGLRPCHLLPCGAKAIAVPSGALKCRWRSPHPSRLRSRWQLCCLTNAAYPLRVLRHATFPQGKALGGRFQPSPPWGEGAPKGRMRGTIVGAYAIGGRPSPPPAGAPPPKGEARESGVERTSLAPPAGELARRSRD